MTRNQLTYWANRETQRSNLAREAETERSNRATEGLRSAELDVRKQELAETGRHNVRSEEAADTQAQARLLGSQASLSHFERMDALNQSALAETMRQNQTVNEQQWRRIYDQAGYWAVQANQQQARLDLDKELADIRNELDIRLKEMDISQRDRATIANFVSNALGTASKFAASGGATK